MTSKEFVMWMKGFTEAIHELGPSPANWQLIKDALEKVKGERECNCNDKTYTYPYRGFTGEYIERDATSKQILND
jgi:hypothetical protein